MTKGYHKLSSLEVIALAKTLEAEIETINGYARYRDPTKSDATIAKALGPRYTTTIVASLRLKIFGPSKPSTHDLLCRIEALELWASLRPKSPFTLP
jgi:hypothetical protein